VKTYAPKTKALAADVILETAVRAAVKRLRSARAPRGNTSTDMRPGSLRDQAMSSAADVMKAACESAALLLGEAS
jgi:hypothetical protein